MTFTQSLHIVLLWSFHPTSYKELLNCIHTTVHATHRQQQGFKNHSSGNYYQEGPFEY